MRGLLLILFCLTSPAAAHGIAVEAKLSPTEVRLHAFFDDNHPAVEAKFTVKAEDQTILHEGVMDSAGQATFPRPNAGRYKIQVDAGDGHLARMTLTIAKDAGDQQGTSREDFTGNSRYVRAGAGVAGLLAAFWLSRYLKRKQQRK
jgi:nickel transport protein